MVNSAAANAFIVPRKPETRDEIRAVADLRRLIEHEMPTIKEGDEFEVGLCESGEPRVTRLNRFPAAIALSGGGIRSSTFNLGILQGLEDSKILQNVPELLAGLAAIWTLLSFSN